MHIRERVCTPDHELLLSANRIWSDYNCPDVFTRPKVWGGSLRVNKSFNETLSRSMDQSVFVLVDFNRCSLSNHLKFTTTRHTQTLDQCFGNVPNAYKAVCRPPLGESDHNVIHLLPKNKARIKQEKPVVKEIKQWSDACNDRLWHCFDDTDWDFFFFFFDNCTDANELSETITLYIQFLWE